MPASPEVLYNPELFWFWPKQIVLSVVAVAQLVESRIVIPVVVGSSPISHPKIQINQALVA